MGEILVEDLMHRDEFIEKMTRLIELSSRDKSWCYAIDGEWGAGKTFILDKLRMKLEENKDYICIKYNAWENDFYEDPLIAILYSILNSKEINKFNDYLKSAINNAIKLYVNKKVPKLTQLWVSVKNIFKKKGDKEAFLENYANYNKVINTLKVELEKYTLNKDDKKDRKIIIFVDELDRCDPYYAMKVLNRLHNIFDIPNLITVVAINKTALNNILDSQYNINNKNEFFDKFFNLTFKIDKDEDKSNMVIKLGNDFLNEIFSDKELNKPMFFNILNGYSYNDLRMIKRNLFYLKFIANNLSYDRCKYSCICLAYILLMNKTKLNNFYCKDDIDATQIINYDICGKINDVIIPSSLTKYIEFNLNNKKADILDNGFDRNIYDFMIVFNLMKFMDSNDIYNILKAYFNIYTIDLEKLYEDLRKMRELIDLIEIE